MIGFYCTKAGIIQSDELVTDITNKILSEVKKELDKTKRLLTETKSIFNSNRIFIVHGHNDKLKFEVARFVEKLGLEAIILSEQANNGKTIIEKIEENTDVGYGIVLYTPCDKGGTAETPYDAMKFRARQNVIFEHGYLIGKLGRDRVCALVDGDIEYPSDINGVVYIPYQGQWKHDIEQELKSIGYEIK
ncbi:MAG: nucleotide-binding protein [Selenomonadaceae bacterium]|nr:nucleotide-binding protein [Selenomonadaceae bacterium]